MFKKIVSLLLAALMCTAMAVSFASCKKTEEDEIPVVKKDKGIFDDADLAAFNKDNKATA